MSGAIFLTFTKKTPLKKGLVEGRKDLDFWIDFVEQRDQIEVMQREVLAVGPRKWCTAVGPRKWCTAVIHGHYDLDQNKPNIVRVKGKTAGCGVYYILAPQVTAIGIDDGVGVIISYLPKAAKEAKRAYEEARESVNRFLEGRRWDEVLNTEEEAK